MSLEAILFQALNGLAAASSLFFVGAGLSLIFRVTRIINIAHGSFYMLGLYLAATFPTKVGGALVFWGGIAAAGLMVAALGALIEVLLLRRVYQAPELFQLLGAFSAGCGGALPVSREPANLGLDLVVISDAFVVVVVGGMGSVTGAFLAAVIIAEVKALCIGIGLVHFGAFALNFSKLTLVAEFLVMAIVLIARPYGLLGRPQGAVRNPAEIEDPIRPATLPFKLTAAAVLVGLLLLAFAYKASPYALVLGIDVLIAVLFATSLHFIMGPGGMHSFGHAAYFGLGAYGAALFLKVLNLPMEAALLLAPLLAVGGALVFGWFCVRLSGVSLAMLTPAFAQIIWSIATQWTEVTGGSNGILGIWPTAPFDSRAAFFLLTAALVVVGVLLLRRVIFAPFGYAMRAGRDSPLRAEAIGIDVRRVHWMGFALAGAVCGVAGGLFAFAKGSISPETIDVGRSIDGLVMVLLGGIQSLIGPIVGASVFTVLQDTVMRQTEYCRAMPGGIILALVLLFPDGIAGSLAKLRLSRGRP